jgi:uncharacterized SAM-binding protein YcdF (DUF218 family)
VVLGLIVAMLVAGIAYFTVTFVQVWRTARVDQARPAGAIVVLGAAQFDGRPSAVYLARLDHAADLYHEGIAPFVVVTGGKQVGDRFTEATAGADYLHDRDVPDDAILREVQGRSTYESLRATRRFLEMRGIDDVVLVTDPFHSLRARLVAEEVGLRAVTSPTRSSPVRGWSERARFVGESVRVMVGRVVGFDRLQRTLGAEAIVLAMIVRLPASRVTTRSGVV